MKTCHTNIAILLLWTLTEPLWSIPARAASGGEVAPAARMATAQAALVTAFSALERGQWVDAWKGFRSVTNAAELGKELEVAGVGSRRDLRGGQALAASYLLARSGHLGEALALMDQEIASFPARTAAFDLKAMVLCQAERFPEASAVLRAAPQHAPGSAHSQLLQAYILLREGKLDACGGLLKTNWSALEGCFLAYNLRGFMALMQGRLGESLNDFDRAEALCPEFTPAVDNRLAAGLIRSEGYYRGSATNFVVSAKGLLGASGTVSGSASYNQHDGISLSLSGTASVDKNSFLGGGRYGVFTLSLPTVEDVGSGSKLNLRAALAGPSQPVRPSAYRGSSKRPELTCPMLLWP